MRGSCRPAGARTKRLGAQAYHHSAGGISPRSRLRRRAGSAPSRRGGAREGRYELLREGKRQIIGFQIAGDLCDLGGLPMGCAARG
ncbi:hypothetical protein ACFOYU_11820 [Microvirga sp. GCM10011540]|uniref:hypothetical protein n=1 Tax=Microvirga sp. GCM10011540 TaxID=3317338 RepID=UPI003616A4F7